MSDYLAKRCAECVSFYRDQIAQAKVQTPYGDGLPAPWAFLDEACRVIESLQSQLAAANERADGLQRIVDEARAQKPVCITTLDDFGTVVAYPPPNVLHSVPLYAAPVPAQPAVVLEVTADDCPRRHNLSQPERHIWALGWNAARHAILSTTDTDNKATEIFPGTADALAKLSIKPKE